MKRQKQPSKTSAPARPRARANSRRTGTCWPDPGGGEFLTTFTVPVPAGTPSPAVEDSEAQCAQELARQGYLLRLWTLPGHARALGLWQAHDTAGIQAILASLPLYDWMSVQTTPLTRHPSDPALTSSGRLERS